MLERRWAALREERFVDAHVPRSLMAPRELPLHSLSPLPPHLGPPFRVVEELDNRTGESVRVVWRRIHRSRSRRDSRLLEIERDDGELERHVLHRLVHRRDVVERVERVR